MAASTTPGTCVLIDGVEAAEAPREGPKIQTPLRHGRRRRVVGFCRGEQVLELAAQLPHLLARRLWGRRPRRRRGRCLLASGHRFGVWIARAFRCERVERLPCVIVTANWRRASEMPCSNECPSTPALELCETAEEASLRLLAEFRVRGAENPYRSPRSQAQRTDNEAASRCPFAS